MESNTKKKVGAIAGLGAVLLAGCGATSRDIEQAFSEEEQPRQRTQSSRPAETSEDKSWTLDPYFVVKRKFNADDSDIGPYNGAGVRVKKQVSDKVGVYGKFEVDKAEDHRKNGTSYAELRSTGYTSGVGAELDLVKGKKVGFKAYGEVLLRQEDNEAYLQAGSATRSVDETENMGGYGAGVRVDFKPNERVNIFVGGGVEKAGENDSGYTVSGGLSIDF